MVDAAKPLSSIFEYNVSMCTVSSEFNRRFPERGMI